MSYNNNWIYRFQLIIFAVLLPLKLILIVSFRRILSFRPVLTTLFFII